jgi:hypothetical protein
MAGQATNTDTGTENGFFVEPIAIPDFNTCNSFFGWRGYARRHYQAAIFHGSQSRRIGQIAVCCLARQGRKT